MKANHIKDFIAKFKNNYQGWNFSTCAPVPCHWEMLVQELGAGSRDFSFFCWENVAHIPITMV